MRKEDEVRHEGMVGTMPCGSHRFGDVHESMGSGATRSGFRSNSAT